MNASVRLMIVLASGCATLPRVVELETEATPESALHSRSGRDRLTLTPADLARPTAGSTLDVLRQLRPEFFVPSARANDMHAAIALYINGTYDGGLTGLNSIPLDAIQEITFLHPQEATFRFGMLCRCEGGAVTVKTKTSKGKAIPF
jgi:hypothetical protein